MKVRTDLGEIIHPAKTFTFNISEVTEALEMFLRNKGEDVPEDKSPMLIGIDRSDPDRPPTLSLRFSNPVPSTSFEE